MWFHFERALESLERVARRCAGDLLWRTCTRGESDETVASQIFQSRSGALAAGSSLVSWLQQQSLFFHGTVPESVRDGCQTSQTRRYAEADDSATPFEIHKHLSTTQQGNWLAGQTRPDLSCQVILAQQCMPSSTVEQTAWVCRDHQFADLKLTCLSIPPAPTVLRKIK